MTEFYSHFEKALRRTADRVGAGRLQGLTDVELVDVTNASSRQPVRARYELFGPGDVQRLAAGAITRRFPAPHASNAEVTKIALVEFTAVDLPWRYTPQLAATGALRPWLVLVVGRRTPEDIVLRSDGRVVLGLVAQANHQLVKSNQWAHVHRVDGHAPFARLLAPPVAAAPDMRPGYLSDTDYVACLVPAFTAAGADAWEGVRPVTLDLYDWWSFRTGPDGDFPQLAGKLRKAKLSLNADGKPFGRAEVTYRSRAVPAITSTLATAGALRLPQLPGDPPDPADSAPSVEVGLETTALTRRIVTPDGRAVLTSPRYDAAFADANAIGSAPDGGWVAQLRGDPRLRGAAGLGAWNAIEWQDRISDAVATRVGDLAIAADRIRHVALGVEASRSLWRRRLPTDPAERLSVLLPSLARLLTTTGQPVQQQIAGRTPQLGLALLSSAARRAFRPGPARTALAGNGRTSFGAVLVAAARCPDEREDPAEIRENGENPATVIEKAILAAAGDDESLAQNILGHLGTSPSAGALEAALRALAPGPDGAPDGDALNRFFDSGDFDEPDRSPLEWRDWMQEHATKEPCRAVDMERLAALVAGSIDPTVTRPPAVERVLATLPGITHIGPVEIEPELDLPLWSFLADRAPDWMLPGAGELEDGDVVALATNPVFVESLLVGANHQITAELRWRNIPLVSRWSPLRKFWQRKAVEPDIARQGNELDIVPIRKWPETDALGSPSMAPGGRRAEAVVAFRTTLFRRYPATVVYLYRQQNDWTPPAANLPLDPAKREDSTFVGTIGRDITFFGFSVAPEQLRDYWVVLEEPPAGYRFTHQPEATLPGPDTHSAQFAQRRFAVPVRVLLGQLLSEPA